MERPHLSHQKAQPRTLPWASGVVLAGGQSRRMGGVEKSLIQLGGSTLVALVLKRLETQVGPLAISANGDPARFASCGVPVLPDTVEGFAGPLAGILTGMLWTRMQAPHATHVLTVAVDTPFFPLDLGARLGAAINTETSIVVASSNGRLHHVFALWPVAVAESLRSWIETSEQRSVHAWLGQQRIAIVEFSGRPIDPFFNTNTPDDLQIAHGLLERNPP